MIESGIGLRTRLPSGVYTPFPGVDQVDFSVLREEVSWLISLAPLFIIVLCFKEEWQLAFHYLLQYPKVLQDAAECKGQIQIKSGLKKVKLKIVHNYMYIFFHISFQLCQFLIKLSHLFSGHYSRHKVLLVRCQLII